MRFYTQEEHDAMIKSLIEEHRFRKRIQELQECRAAGWRTMAEADKYLQQKRRREAELNAQKAKEGSQVTGGSKGLQKSNRAIKGESDASPCSTGDNNIVKGVGSETNGKDSSYTIKSIDEWDILRLPGADLLNDTEQRFCCENRLLPSHYLKMQEVLVAEILKGRILQKSDANSLFKVDPLKIDKIFDIVSKKLDLHSGLASL